MALPEGVTTCTVTAGVPVTHTGAPVKAFVSIEPSVFLVHTATGTPLVDFLEELSINEGVAGQFTLPHTDQAGFQDENGNAYTNWYYTARISYSTPSKAKTKAPKIKVFQLVAGQTVVDLDALPGGAPALPYTAPIATVTSLNGRTGPVTVTDADLPERLSDTSLSATILDTGDANYGPPVSALQDFMGRAKTGVSDLNILIVSDSTGAAGGSEPASWARRLPAKLGPLFPEYTIQWVLWDSVANAYSTTVTTAQTGTGTKKIKLWLAAVAGQSWQYHWDTTRREAMLYAPKADLVMFSLGHNDNSTNAQNGSTELIREKPIVHIEQMRTFFPSASVVLLSQNPLLNFNVASENRANVFRRIAAQRGYGFIDVCRAFHDDPRPLTDLILTSDGTHPTEAGYELWANKVLESFRTTPGAQPLTAPASAFYEPKKNWAPNGDLASLDGSNLPLTWTAQNTTVTKDTADFETGTYSLVLTKTAGGATANVEVSLPLGLMRGQTVTVAVRLKVTGDAGLNAAGQIAGRIDVRDSKGIYASDVWNLPDQWVWRMRTHRYDPDVTYTRFRIATDPTTAASAQVKIDRVVAVLGEYPSDLL